MPRASLHLPLLGRALHSEKVAIVHWKNGFFSVRESCGLRYKSPVAKAMTNATGRMPSVCHKRSPDG